MDREMREMAEKQELLHDNGARIMASQGAAPEKRKDDEDELDPIAQSIGNYGKWQLKMTFLLSLCSFPCTFHIFSPTFISGETNFWCARPKEMSWMSVDQWRKISQPHDSCSIYDFDWTNYDGHAPPANTSLIACTHWEFDNSTFSSTTISEWQLVCDHHYLNTLADVLFLAGIAIGGVISGMISDRFGRKKTLIFSVVMQTLLAFLITFCPWFEMYLALRITLGFFSVAVVFSAFVIIVELVGGKWRTISGVCNFFPLPVSYIVVSLLSMAIPNWRMLQLALSVPGALLILLWWVIPESPHWLLTTGRIDEVKAIVHQAAAYNKRKIPKNIDQILRPAASSEEQASILDILRGKMLKITVLVFIMWFGTTLVYYGLVLNINNFAGGNLYLTSILSGVVELPAIALSIPTLLKMGRRYPICLSMMIAGGCCLGMAFSEKVGKQWLTISILLISKFCIGATNGVLPTFTAELYPTLMRNMGVGSSQVSAGIGLVIIPYLWTQFFTSTVTPTLITGMAGILGGLCVLLLPETKNKSLTAAHADVETPESAANQSSPSNEKTAN